MNYLEHDIIKTKLEFNNVPIDTIGTIVYISKDKNSYEIEFEEYSVLTASIDDMKKFFSKTI